MDIKLIVFHPSAYREMVVPVRVIKGSKGDACFVCRHHLFISDVKYDYFLKLVRGAESVTIRSELTHETRKYSLVRVFNIKMDVSQEVEYTIFSDRKDREVAVNGVEVYPVDVTCGRNVVVKERLWSASWFSKELKEKVVYEEDRKEKTIRIDNSLNAEEVWLFNPFEGKFCYSDHSTMEYEDVGSVDEELLLELSKYYVVAFPLVIAKKGKTYWHRYVLYYDGKKEVVRLTSRKRLIPPLFSIRRRRYSVANVPPGVKVDWYSFAEAARALHRDVRGIDARIKCVHPVEEFFEKYYEKTPGKKARHVLKVYNFVQTLRDMGYDARAKVVFKKGLYRAIWIEGERLRPASTKGVTTVYVKKEIPGEDRWLLDFLKMSEREQLSTLRKVMREYVFIADLDEHDIVKMIASEREGILGVISQFIKKCSWIDSDDVMCCLKTLARMALRMPADVESGDAYGRTLKVVRAAVRYALKLKGYNENGEWELKFNVENMAKRLFGGKRVSALFSEITDDVKGVKPVIRVDRVKMSFL